MNKKSLYLLLIVALTWLSCDQSKTTTESVVASYPTVKISAHKTVLYLEFPTTLEGVETVEVRSKIDGYIEEVYVEEGSQVHMGQKLFRIDSNQFAQDVNQRKAAISAIEAALETTHLQVQRTQILVDKNIVNSFELTTAKNLERVKKAELIQAKSALSDAQSQLAFTHIVSPIDGVVGRLPFKKGALVQSTSTLALTTIANTKQVYAHFAVNQQQLNRFLAPYAGSDLSEKLKNMPEVTLVTSDGIPYEQTGKIQSLSGILNAQTGSANFRALFPNPQRILWSGASAVLKIPTQLDEALLLPKKAVFEIQGKYFVYKMDAKNQVSPIEIEVLSTATAQEYIVQSGLKIGDIVVTEGIGTLKNGMTIRPTTNSEQ